MFQSFTTRSKHSTLAAVLTNIYSGGQANDFIAKIGCSDITFYRWMYELHTPSAFYMQKILKVLKLKKFNKYI